MINLVEQRTQYGVFLLDSDSSRAEGLAQPLMLAGFRVQIVESLERAVFELKAHPPHAVLLFVGAEMESTAEALALLRARLPESHFFVLGEAAHLAEVWRSFSNEICDGLTYPLVHPQALVRALDRAMERDTLMYWGEELREELQRLRTSEARAGEAPMVEVTAAEKPTDGESVEEGTAFVESLLPSEEEPELDFVTSPNLALAEIARDSESTLNPVATKSEWDMAAWLEVLSQARTVEGVIGELLTASAQRWPGARLLYLRYLANRRCLVATAAQGLQGESWRGMGLDLSREADFSLQSLAEGKAPSALVEFFKEAFSSQQHEARTFTVREGLHGFLALLDPLPESERLEFERMIHGAERAATLLDLKTYVHSIELHDLNTRLLHRQALSERLALEVARSRRILMPVSLVLISLDGHGALVKAEGQEAGHLAMRALGKIIQPRSRVNDILGRVSEEELGLILPHTAKDGAVIKAERIRRLVEAADFSRVLPKTPRLTVTIGISEYPTCCRDADDLFSSADNALWQLKNKTVNRLCVATPVPGFNPDFLVAAK